MVQGKALMFFLCTRALWKLPHVKLISVILRESRVWGEGLADGSPAWSLWPSHATGRAQVAVGELNRKLSKREKAPCFGILVHPLGSPVMLSPAGDWFCNRASWPLGVNDVQPPTSFSPDYWFWSPLAAPTRQNNVKKECSYLCRSMFPFHRQSDLLLAPVSSVWEPARRGRSLLGWSRQMIALDTSDFSTSPKSAGSLCGFVLLRVAVGRVIYWIHGSRGCFFIQCSGWEDKDIKWRKKTVSLGQHQNTYKFRTATIQRVLNVTRPTCSDMRIPNHLNFPTFTAWFCNLVTNNGDIISFPCFHFIGEGK